MSRSSSSPGGSVAAVARGREEYSTARVGRGTAGRLVSAVLVASAATGGDGLIAAAAATGVGGGGGGGWRGSSMLSAGRRGGAAALRWRAGRAVGGETSTSSFRSSNRCRPLFNMQEMQAVWCENCCYLPPHTVWVGRDCCIGSGSAAAVSVASSFSIAPLYDLAVFCRKASLA